MTESLAILMAGALAVGGMLLAAAVSWRKRQRVDDMGTMSDHWIAEQRLRRGGDPNR